MIAKRHLLPVLALLPLVPALGQQAAERAASRFDQWDRNGDGKLAREELPAALRKNFDRVDRNDDGFISREEDAAVRAGGRRSTEAGRMLEGIRKVADVDYAGTGNPRQALDLYLPEEPKSGTPLPLLVFIHGGGWQKGDKASGISRLRPFIAGGDYAGASIGYRLSGEAPWPAQIHDCKAALRWLRANAAEHGIDPDRIAVWGTSAGGHLVAMLGVSEGVAELEGELGEHRDQSSAVQAVVNFFGPSELLTMNDHPSTIDHDAPGSPESRLIGGAIQENPERARQASPITHVGKGDAPMLIVHGTEDKLVPYPQSTALAERLGSADVPVALLTVEGGGHGQGFGPAVAKAVEDFLASSLLGAEREIGDRTVKAGE